jgi:hypothetical protein
MSSGRLPTLPNFCWEGAGRRAPSIGKTGGVSSGERADKKSQKDQKKRAETTKGRMENGNKQKEKRNEKNRK